nr:MAG: hypothetical protein CM15mV30_0360 [uncultured marine virus]
MADQKISELTAATSGASADLLHVVQGGTNKKLTVANLFAGIDTNVKLDGFLALEGTAQAITAAGSTQAINTTSSICEITSNSATTGGNSLTLANGVQGQIKIITMVADSGDVEVRLPTLQTYRYYICDVGDTVTLIYLTSKWVAMSNVGSTIA